jgi:hypothetical protein
MKAILTLGLRPIYQENNSCRKNKLAESQAPSLFDRDQIFILHTFAERLAFSFAPFFWPHKRKGSVAGLAVPQRCVEN